MGRVEEEEKGRMRREWAAHVPPQASLCPQSRVNEGEAREALTLGAKFKEAPKTQQAR